MPRELCVVVNCVGEMLHNVMVLAEQSRNLNLYLVAARNIRM